MKIEGLTYPAPKMLSGPKETPKEDFMKFLREELKAVDQAQKEAAQKLKDFATGKDPDLSGLTLSLTKADLSFRFLLQVRNKVLQAYEEIMRMQL